MTHLKPENFIVIPAWARMDLALKGTELIIYSIIYGFSQTDGQYFTGSLAYLADWTGATKKTIIESLKSLQEKGLIEKEEHYDNNIKFCKYWCKNYTGGVKITPVVKKLQSSGVKITPASGVKITPNNIINNNIENNIEKQSSGKQMIESEFEECWNLYPRKEGKKSALAAFKRARKNGTTVEQIKQGIINYNNHIKSAKIENRFIKQGSTYFNGEHWNDTYTIATSTNTTQTDGATWEVGITDDFFE